jgi:anti-sigma factor RsiW
MTQPGRPINDEDLHAYIDGRLDAARRLAVAIYLAGHPREAARGEAFRAQKEAIRALFDHVLDQPVPDRLREVMQQHGERPSWTAWRRVAWAVAAGSLVLVLVLGGRALHDYFPFMRNAVIEAPHPTGTGYEVKQPPLLPQPAARRNADI